MFVNQLGAELLKELESYLPILQLFVNVSKIRETAKKTKLATR